MNGVYPKPSAEETTVEHASKVALSCVPPFTWIHLLAELNRLLWTPVPVAIMVPRATALPTEPSLTCVLLTPVEAIRSKVPVALTAVACRLLLIAPLTIRLTACFWLSKMNLHQLGDVLWF